MPKRNCENCGQVIGNLEESYSYYGRVVCRACMIRLENLFQAPGTTNGDSETEASTAEVRTQKDSVSEGETPLTENRAATELSHETLARKEDSPDSQTLKNALASSEQKETPRMNRTQLIVLWVPYPTHFRLKLRLMQTAFLPLWISYNRRRIKYG